MGYSNSHSSTVSLILNLKTGSITPQYHLVHNDWLITVSYATSSTLPKSLWDHIISSGYEWETYEIPEDQYTWPDCEVSTSSEEDIKDLDT